MCDNRHYASQPIYSNIRETSKKQLTSSDALCIYIMIRMSVNYECALKNRVACSLPSSTGTSCKRVNIQHNECKDVIVDIPDIYEAR